MATLLIVIALASAAVGGLILLVRWVGRVSSERAAAHGKAATAEAKQRVAEDRATREVAAAHKDKELTDAIAHKKPGSLDRLRARRRRMLRGDDPGDR